MNSKGVFAVAAYPRSPMVAGPSWSPPPWPAPYTFITHPSPALLPSHSPMAQLQQRIFFKGGEQALGAFSKGGD
jgi:hypothetical protein